MPGDYAYSFLLGVLASVNPCGFVMLPAYLARFLGGSLDTALPRSAYFHVRRAFIVSSAVSGGFLFVFVTVGTLIRQIDSLDFLVTEARWAGLAVGIAMTFAGVAMLFCWSPRLPVGRLVPTVDNSSSAWTMFVFGVGYAIASIGCTIGLFVAGIFGSFTRNGFVGGVASTVMYGAGMAMVVTALTVAIAFARSGLSSRLRSASQHVHTVSSVVVVLSGAYLSWYWFGAIFREGRGDRVTSRMGDWQTRLSSWLQDRGALEVAVTLGMLLAIGAVVLLRRHFVRESNSQIEMGPSQTN